MKEHQFMLLTVVLKNGHVITFPVTKWDYKSRPNGDESLSIERDGSGVLEYYRRNPFTPVFRQGNLTMLIKAGISIIYSTPTLEYNESGEIQTIIEY